MSYAWERPSQQSREGRSLTELCCCSDDLTLVRHPGRCLRLVRLACSQDGPRERRPDAYPGSSRVVGVRVSRHFLSRSTPRWRRSIRRDVRPGRRWSAGSRRLGWRGWRRRRCVGGSPGSSLTRTPERCDEGFVLEFTQLLAGSTSRCRGVPTGATTTRRLGTKLSLVASWDDNYSQRGPVDVAERRPGQQLLAVRASRCRWVSAGTTYSRRFVPRGDTYSRRGRVDVVG